MTMIEELKALAEKATPGPWEAIGTNPAEGGDWFWITAQPHPAMRGFTKEIGAINGSQSDPTQTANAALIVALVNNLPAILSALEAVPVMKEALAFYAREQSWRSMGMHMCGHSPDCTAVIDGGKHARQALAALRETHHLIPKDQEPVGWMPIETAPRDGTPFVGTNGKYAYRTKLGRAYVLWPHEPGGPTFEDKWNAEDSSSIWPWNPTHWQPLYALEKRHD